ncbi:hypothetical protein Acr_26g0000870 [Actinidia rufa]|uniref:Reverse transcriptase/retrotransposon-derived protein RNase H-like domain-containing protein n=1 Tax=Actinidia rufa TaxID=165716 RepID=A0A7J0H117_9ERIC|nr:hypothetical protein Acr_26g0000870 [Actinidia rufa]
MPSLEHTPPYPIEIACLPYPEGNVTSKFSKFNGRIGSACEHVVRFIETLGAFCADKNLRLREFSRSLTEHVVRQPYSGLDSKPLLVNLHLPTFSKLLESAQNLGDSVRLSFSRSHWRSGRGPSTYVTEERSSHGYKRRCDYDDPPLPLPYKYNEARAILDKLVEDGEGVSGIFLGYVIHRQGIEPDPAKSHAIIEMSRSGSLKELKALFVTVSYLRRYIPALAEIIWEFSALLKKNAIYQWTDDHQQAFESIKRTFLSPKVMIAPHKGQSLYHKSIGALLTQEMKAKRVQYTTSTV